MSDHAADPTEVLTPGIGSDSQVMRRQEAVQFGQEDPGLDGDRLLRRVELHDLLEPGRVQDHTRSDGCTGEGRSGGPRGERHPEFAADLKRRDDIGFGLDEHHCSRLDGARTCVRRVRVKADLVGAYAIRAEGLFERTTQVPVPR